MRRAMTLFLLILMLFVFCTISFCESATDLAERFLKGSEEYSVRFGIQFSHLNPFDEKRTDELNSLLKHFSFNANQSKDHSEYRILCDEKKLAGVSIKEGEINQYLFSFDPDHIYKTHNDLFFQTQDPFVEKIDMFRMIPDTAQALMQLPDVFPQLTHEEKIKTKIKNAGTAFIKRTVTFTRQSVSEGILDEWGKNFLKSSVPCLGENLFFTDRQQIILFLDENDHLLKANYSGKAGVIPDQPFKISLVFSAVENNNRKYRDISLRCNAEKGNDYLYIHYVSEEKPEQFSDSADVYPESTIYSAELSCDWRENKIKRKYFIEANLFSTREGLLTGDIEMKKESEGNKMQIHFTPEIEWQADDKINGSTLVAVKDQNGIQSEFSLSFLIDSSAEEQLWPETVFVDLDKISEAEKKQLEENLSLKLSSSFLKTVLHLPEQDLLFLSDGINPENWLSVLAVITP